MKTKLQTPAAFFRANAGYSYSPGKETRAQGRTRCARALADAERWAQSVGISYEWAIDYLDSSEFSDETPAWELWCCVAKDQSDRVVGSLSGIDFGRDGAPWGEPYKRVVEAELANEAMPNEASV